MKQVKFKVNGKEYTVGAGVTVLEALRSAGASIYAPCGGNGRCGKCKVRIYGALSKMDESEASKLTADEIRSGVRLSCRATLLGDAEAIVTSDDYGILTDGKTGKFDLSPLTESGVGVAVDVGTTTVAVYLYDLETGKPLRATSFANPQSSYGGDVISRIDKIMKSKAALGEQRDLIIGAINAAVADACRKLGKSAKDVGACVVCGNTVMQSIAAGIDPSTIAVAPFTAPTLFSDATFDAQKLGFDFRDGAVCMFAPCISSYVGGDISCGLVASSCDKATDNAVFLDVGTNGEIVLAANGELYACSAAAGPALEGAGIECGMGGVPGAISRIFFDGDIKFETIGALPPRGICGSGIVDAIAVMLRCGAIDETGAFSDEYPENILPRIKEVASGDAFFIDDAIYVSERDVRQIQLAKAAICAGINTLLAEAKITADDVSRLILAGGFGSKLDPESVCEIGLVPREFSGKITFAGNTAGMGAVALLLSGDARRRAAKLCGRTKYIELSSNAFFMENYIEQMSF